VNPYLLLSVKLVRRSKIPAEEATVTYEKFQSASRQMAEHSHPLTVVLKQTRRFEVSRCERSELVRWRVEVTLRLLEEQLNNESSPCAELSFKV